MMARALTENQDLWWRMMAESLLKEARASPMQDSHRLELERREDLQVLKTNRSLESHLASLPVARTRKQVNPPVAKTRRKLKKKRTRRVSNQIILLIRIYVFEFI